MTAWLKRLHYRMNEEVAAAHGDYRTALYWAQKREATQ